MGARISVPVPFDCGCPHACAPLLSALLPDALLSIILQYAGPSCEEVYAQVRNYALTLTPEEILVTDRRTHYADPRMGCGLAEIRFEDNYCLCLKWMYSRFQYLQRVSRLRVHAPAAGDLQWSNTLFSRHSAIRKGASPLLGELYDVLDCEITALYENRPSSLSGSRGHCPNRPRDSKCVPSDRL